MAPTQEAVCTNLGSSSAYVKSDQERKASAAGNPQQGLIFRSGLRLLLGQVHIVTWSAAPPTVLALPTAHRLSLRERNFRMASAKRAVAAGSRSKSNKACRAASTTRPYQGSAPSGTSSATGAGNCNGRTSAVRGLAPGTCSRWRCLGGRVGQRQQVRLSRDLPLEDPPSAACHIAHRGALVELFVDACRHDPRRSLSRPVRNSCTVLSAMTSWRLREWCCVQAGAAGPGARREKRRGELGATSRTALGLRAACMSGVAGCAFSCMQPCNS